MSRKYLFASMHPDYGLLLDFHRFKGGRIVFRPHHEGFTGYDRLRGRFICRPLTDPDYGVKVGWRHKVFF